MADEGSGQGGGYSGPGNTGNYEGGMFSPLDPVSTNPQSPLAAFNDYKDRLTGWERAQLALDLANPFGKSTMLDVLGIDRALGAFSKGASMAFGPFGTLMGFAARAGMAGTGRSSDFGGGFGPGDRGTGLGAEQPADVAAALGGSQLSQTMRELKGQLEALMAQYRMQDVFAEHQDLSEEVAQLRATFGGSA